MITKDTRNLKICPWVFLPGCVEADTEECFADSAWMWFWVKAALILHFVCLYVCSFYFEGTGGRDEDWGIKRSGALCGAADGRSWDSKCDHVWLQWCTVSSLCKDQGLPEKNVSLLIRNVQPRVSNDDLMVIFILKNDNFMFDTKYSCHLKMELLAVFWAAFGQHVSKWTLSVSFNDLNKCNLNTERS